MKEKLIETDKYLLITNDEDIKVGDYTVNLKSQHKHMEVCRIDNEIELERYAKKEVNDCKVISWHLPLNGAPILEGVCLLPEIYTVEERMADLYGSRAKGSIDYMLGCQKGFEDGYKERAKTYLFTEYDIRDAMRMVFDWSENDNHEDCSSLTELVDKFLSLKKQIYPNFFVFETEMGIVENNGIHNIWGDVIQTTTNHLGQTVAVGEYIFE